MTIPTDVLTFWFEECSPADWFKKDSAFDLEIKKRFGQVHRQATQQLLSNWRTTVEGRLAEIIILDQFSRNIYRDSPLAFAFDELAIELTKQALPFAQQLPAVQRRFLYMPLMHSENIADQTLSLQLFKSLGLEKPYYYAQQHAQIIQQFGRFPFRNAILNRESTVAEIEYLQTHQNF